MKNFCILFFLSPAFLFCQIAPSQGQIIISHFSADYANATDEFVVLYNNTDNSIDLNGFELRYYAASGSNQGVITGFTSATVIQSRKHILLSPNAIVTVGTVSKSSDLAFTAGMNSSSGQLVLRQTASPNTIIYALAWGTISSYVASMTDAATIGGTHGMISLTQSSNTYTRTAYNSSNTQYSWTTATNITNIPSSGDAALPVELTSFTSSVNENKVTLNWTTAMEVNNYGFEILRGVYTEQSEGAQNDNWEKIGFVQGHGNSNSPKNYSFTDKPTRGKEFQYRLKQIDFNGAFEYSEITTAILENVNEFKLAQNYPNPFNPMTRISYTLPVRSNVKLRVYDLLAQKVAELVDGIQEAGRYEVTFDGSSLPSGAYFYKLEAGNYVEVKKLLLVK